MLRQETWSFTNPPVRRDHLSMKILTNISRFLLGLIFLVFGLNGFLHFIPMPPPSGVAGQFLGAMFVSKYLLVVSGLQVDFRRVASDQSLRAARTHDSRTDHREHSLVSRPDESGRYRTGGLVTIFWGVVFVSVRSAFAGIFQARVDMKTAPSAPARACHFTSLTTKSTNVLNEDKTMSRTILITGVTGQQGGAVAQALQGSGFRLRGLTRKPESERAAALARQRRRRRQGRSR